MSLLPGKRYAYIHRPLHVHYVYWTSGRRIPRQTHESTRSTTRRVGCIWYGGSRASRGVSTNRRCSSGSSSFSQTPTSRQVCIRRRDALWLGTGGWPVCTYLHLFLQLFYFISSLSHRFLSFSAHPSSAYFHHSLSGVFFVSRLVEKS